MTPPFDGAPDPPEPALVARLDESDWKAMALDVEHELHRFRARRLDRRGAERVRQLLNRAAELGLAQSHADQRGRHLAMMTWLIVKVRLERPAPAYPKSKTETGKRRYQDRLGEWQASLRQEISRRCRLGAKAIGLNNVAGAVNVLGRRRGPAPLALAVAHRVYVALAQRLSAEISPSATVKLTPRLRELLVAHAPKHILSKRIVR